VPCAAASTTLDARSSGAASVASSVMQSEVGNGEEENDLAIGGKQHDAFDLSIRGVVRSKNGGRAARSVLVWRRQVKG
jgi:hypothetical protein